MVQRVYFMTVNWQLGQSVGAVSCSGISYIRKHTVFIVGLLATRPNMPVYIAKRPIMTVVFSVI